MYQALLHKCHAVRAGLCLVCLGNPLCDVRNPSPHEQAVLQEERDFHYYLNPRRQAALTAFYPGRSPEDCARIFDYQSAGLRLVRRNGLLQPAPLHSPFYTIEGGRRRVADVPARWQHTLHLLGDAPALGLFAPDDQTVASCLQRAFNAHAPESVRVLNPASGGPFFGMKKEELAGKTRADALKHPNWNMGAKITIDSATLMNKGLELIEAVWLFGLPPEKIQVVVQRQSIIHSMVQFSDNSILAQLGVPDMRIPIQYALTWPDRFPGCAPELDFTQLKSITFDVADEETFRCLAACKKAIAKGGLGPCAANGANEEAVRLFLEDKIGFLDIGRLVEAVVDSDSFGGSYTLADVYECDRMARQFVLSHI